MARYSKELEIALDAAVKAGENIMEVYNSTESINYEKKADNSPLTVADKKSHNTIIDFLKEKNQLMELHLNLVFHVDGYYYKQHIHIFFYIQSFYNTTNLQKTMYF